MSKLALAPSSPPQRTRNSETAIIAAVCLFLIPPLGEIANSAISIVSELLVLCGAILGVKASYDVKLRKFQAELDQIIDNERKTEPEPNL